MPMRAALNAVYAIVTKGMDRKERERFDTELYGWDEANTRANRDLRRGIDDGGGEG